MPTIKINGANLYYEDQGSGPETIVFAHSLLFSLRMFADQVEVLKDKYRCVSLDFRGQGKSEVSPNGYDMDSLTEDWASFIREMDCGPCHFVGFSMGGFVGQRLAIRHSQLLKSLILVDTSSEPEPPQNMPRYRLMTFVARWFGLKLLVGQVMPIMFGQAFLKDPNRKDLKRRWENELTSNHRIGVTRAVKGVLNRQGITGQIAQIKMPTLILIGEEDVATAPAKSEKMHQLIDGSQLVKIPRAGHMSPVEEPELVNNALTQFLNQTLD